MKSWREATSGPAWLHSPHLNSWQKKILNDLKKRVPKVKDHLWILSSGTQSVNEVKAICLSFEALLTSAAAVNEHLSVGPTDRWLLTLPTYHVGGLSILTRAHLSRSKVFTSAKWDARKFAQQVNQDRITLISLVPTQVHDLVKAGLTAPDHLRAIVVGGGNLDTLTYQSARSLGWPVLPSYGLTECCSQVATATLKTLDSKFYPDLTILNHVELELREQRIFLRSKSLCRWIARGNTEGLFSLEDPRREGWLPTEDLGEKSGRNLKVLGRRDDVVKVLGVLVPLHQVELEARKHFQAAGLLGDLAILAIGGGREENQLILVTDSPHSLSDWERQIDLFNAKSPGPQRLRQFAWVPSIPRSELGKVKRASLLASLGLC